MPLKEKKMFEDSSFFGVKVKRCNRIHLTVLFFTKEEITDLKNSFYRVRFPKKLGLDAGIGSWDLENRIPRRNLRM